MRITSSRHGSTLRIRATSVKAPTKLRSLRFWRTDARNNYVKRTQTLALAQNPIIAMAFEEIAGVSRRRILVPPVGKGPGELDRIHYCFGAIVPRNGLHCREQITGFAGSVLGSARPRR